jgi:hypothetical protein
MDMMWAIVSSREALERFGRIDCCAISLPLRLIAQSSLRFVLMWAGCPHPANHPPRWLQPSG